MHRALVAILAINDNVVASTEQLIDELWSRQPPDGARATLQFYVSVLRQKCREAGNADLVETRSPGYVLPPDPIETDAAAFRAHIGAAQQVGAAAAEADQHEHLVAALALVQGPILPALDHLDTVRLFINDIEEHRCWEARELVEVDLRRGRASDVIPRLRTRAWLSALVDDEPLTLEQRNIARVSWPPWPNFGGVPVGWQRTRWLRRASWATIAVSTRH